MWSLAQSQGLRRPCAKWGLWAPNPLASREMAPGGPCRGLVLTGPFFHVPFVVKARKGRWGGWGVERVHGSRWNLPAGSQRQRPDAQSLGVESKPGFPACGLHPLPALGEPLDGVGGDTYRASQATLLGVQTGFPWLSGHLSPEGVSQLVF